MSGSDFSIYQIKTTKFWQERFSQWRVKEERKKDAKAKHVIMVE